MRSTLRALLLVAAVSLVSACTSITAPNDDAECSVVTGSNTCLGE